jgi:hypothetical protein
MMNNSKSKHSNDPSKSKPRGKQNKTKKSSKKKNADSDNNKEQDDAVSSSAGHYVNTLEQPLTRRPFRNTSNEDTVETVYAESNHVPLVIPKWEKPDTQRKSFHLARDPRMTSNPIMERDDDMDEDISNEAFPPDLTNNELVHTAEVLQSIIDINVENVKNEKYDLGLGENNDWKTRFWSEANTTTEAPTTVPVVRIKSEPMDENAFNPSSEPIEDDRCSIDSGSVVGLPSPGWASPPASPTPSIKNGEENQTAGDISDDNETPRISPEQQLISSERKDDADEETNGDIRYEVYKHPIATGPQQQRPTASQSAYTASEVAPQQQQSVTPAFSIQPEMTGRLGAPAPHPLAPTIIQLQQQQQQQQELQQQRQELQQQQQQQELQQHQQQQELQQQQQQQELQQQQQELQQQRQELQQQRQELQQQQQELQQQRQELQQQQQQQELQQQQQQQELQQQQQQQELQQQRQELQQQRQELQQQQQQQELQQQQQQELKQQRQELQQQQQELQQHQQELQQQQQELQQQQQQQKLQQQQQQQKLQQELQQQQQQQPTTSAGGPPGDGPSDHVTVVTTRDGTSQNNLPSSSARHDAIPLIIRPGKRICYNCRKGGHIKKNCPELLNLGNF